MNVIWSELARDQLADIYATLDLAGQRELAREVERIIAELATDPLHRGESRGGDDRIWCTGPLAITFRPVRGGPVRVLTIGDNRPRRERG